MFDLWRKLEPLPGGKWLFSKLFAFFAPYSGSIKAVIVSLEPGNVVLELKDRRRVRNHLNSIHAIALANMGELTSGLAVLGILPPGIRGIVTALSIEYYKKARGRLLAESHCTPPKVTEQTGEVEYEVTTDIRDAEGETVARTTVKWRLGVEPPRHE